MSKKYVYIRKQGNPDYRAALKMISKLENAIHCYDVADSNIDMSEAYIPTCDEHLCGTSACHGGWYYIAEKGMKIYGSDVSFTDGAGFMAKDLGFSNMRQLERWADSNPRLWGNREGGEMFSSDDAFFPDRYESPIMQEIVDHWYGVAERLYNLQVLKQEVA